MAPILLGAITGFILSATASFLITGRLFHGYQQRTPATWRAESWRHHMGAMLLQAVAGAAIGWLFEICGAPAVSFGLAKLGFAVWMMLGTCILIQSLYVNWHAGFVVGLMLDWSVFIAVVLLVCACCSTHWDPP